MRTFQDLFQIYHLKNQSDLITTGYIGRKFISFIPLFRYGIDLISEEDIKLEYLDSALIRYLYLSKLGIILFVEELKETQIELIVYDMIVNEMEENLIIVYHKI
jgi:hypothetical protein